MGDQAEREEKRARTQEKCELISGTEMAAQIRKEVSQQVVQVWSECARG